MNSEENQMTTKLSDFTIASIAKSGRALSQMIRAMLSSKRGSLGQDPGSAESALQADLKDTLRNLAKELGEQGQSENWSVDARIPKVTTSTDEEETDGLDDLAVPIFFTCTNVSGRTYSVRKSVGAFRDRETDEWNASYTVEGV
jgi:hypothetical protein